MEYSRYARGILEWRVICCTCSVVMFCPPSFSWELWRLGMFLDLYKVTHLIWRPSILVELFPLFYKELLSSENELKTNLQLLPVFYLGTVRVVAHVFFLFVIASAEVISPSYHFYQVFILCKTPSLSTDPSTVFQFCPWNSYYWSLSLSLSFSVSVSLSLIWTVVLMEVDKYLGIINSWFLNDTVFPNHSNLLINMSCSKCLLFVTFE
jgi:hypothetical protein